MENKKTELDVVSFTRPRESYNRTKEASVSSTPPQRRKVKKSKKIISKFKRAKKKLAFLSLGISITLAGIAITKADDIKQYFENNKIIVSTLDEYERVVEANKHIVLDENGKPKFDNTNDVMHYFNYDYIGEWMRDKLDDNYSEKEVVYGVYNTMITSPADIDDFYKAMKAAGLPYEEDSWAHDNGYTGMDDKRLKEDAFQEYLENYKMIHTDQETINKENNKSMGGK